MTSGKLDSLPNAWVDSLPGKRFVVQSGALAQVELIKLFRDPAELFSRAVQPVLWLAVFGQVFSHVRGVPTGSTSYLDFIAPGILAQGVLFSGIFYGISVIWEKDLGILQKLLVSPASRSALAFAKAVSAGFRGLVQTFIIYALALLMGIGIRWEFTAMLGVVGAVLLGSAIFSSFSLVIACLVKTRERFMGIGQLLTMPLFFASNAIYPTAIMPPWLRVVAHFNPLTYVVDALRVLMLSRGESPIGLVRDFSVLIATAAILIGLGARAYPRIVV